MFTPASMPDLPENKRYIATHNEHGKSVYLPTPTAQTYFPPFPGTKAIMARSYAVANTPAVLAEEADIKGYLAPAADSVTSSELRHIVTSRDDINGNKDVLNGANLIVMDMAPGDASPMHRTTSLDFSICTIGTIIHELDSGEQVTLKPGDHIVQRGTNHKWINASDTQPARLVAVTVPAIPFDIPGFGILRDSFE